MRKEKVVYSTERDVETEESLETVKRKMRQAEDRHDVAAFAKILIALGEDPDSDSFKKRMTAFRRACNLD
jgi:hypothetical protein